MGIVSRVKAVVAGGALVAGLTASAIATPAVSADPDFPLNQSVTATTHLAKLNRDVVNTGTFVGTLDFGTGEIVGDLSLGATETELQLLGLPLAKVGVQVVPTQQNHGQVNFADLTLTMTTTFNIKITYVKPLGLFNVVGNNCQTSSPVTLESTGNIEPGTAKTTLAGSFEIPQFENCGIATIGLNLLVPGPGNTFMSVAVPV